MCGIFGYAGERHDVAQTVGTALRALEYRGYDSWGIVWQQGKTLQTVKKTGRVPSTLSFECQSPLAVGHTRWATHGGVTEANAHPHLDCTGRIAIVHNGIVENAPALRQTLNHHHRIVSETDSEIIAHLIEERLVTNATLLDAIREVFPLLAGSNAVIALDQHGKEIVAVMNVSPLVIGLGARGAYIASDPYALNGQADRMIIVAEGSIVRLHEGEVEIYDQQGGRRILPDSQPVPIAQEGQLGTYQHYMAKEMADQPAILAHHAGQEPIASELAVLVQNADQIILTGCGSALFAARIGASWIGRMLQKRAIAVAASDFPEMIHFLQPGSLVLGLSQSGETADLLDALRLSKGVQVRTAAIVNVMHSTAARMADDVFPLDAGRERSVLATKSFTAMLSRLLSATDLGMGDGSGSAKMLSEASMIIADLQTSAAFARQIDMVADRFARAGHILVIGKGHAVGVAQEAALKIKEASYVHAEAFTAGELKHGAIALVEPGTPCLMLDSDETFATDIASTTQELRSRGGYTVNIGLRVDGAADETIAVSGAGVATPIVHAYVAQHLAYRMAILRGLNPDYPRNLAKSVTVK
jgi:glucosamine--fructose-6-phosphate aminotransferase (isomerizing)